MYKTSAKQKAVERPNFKPGDFVALKEGKTKWYMAEVVDADEENEELKLKFMRKFGERFIFVEGTLGIL